MSNGNRRLFIMIDEKYIREATDAYLREHGYESIKLKAAMFDMDGVLFDSMRNHAKSWHETMAHFGMDLPEWEAYMHEGRTGAGTINIVSMRERGHEATKEEIADIYVYKSNLFNKCPKAERMPWAYELLQKVKASGVVPMVVTGSGQKTLLERLNRNFPDVFQQDLMVTAFDVKYGKPNPEPYLMGMEKYKAFVRKCGGTAADATVCADGVSRHTSETLAPDNFIVVENAPLGVEAGVAAGVFTIAVNTGPLPDDALLSKGANILFHSMQEFFDSWDMVKAVLI